VLSGRHPPHFYLLLSPSERERERELLFGTICAQHGCLLIPLLISAVDSFLLYWQINRTRLSRQHLFRLPIEKAAKTSNTTFVFKGLALSRFAHLSWGCARVGERKRNTPCNIDCFLSTPYH